MCVRCERPEPVCVCSALPPNGEKIRLQTKILVIQHPCECRKKIIGTVPLMQLCLENCELLVAKGCGQSAAINMRGRRGRKSGNDGENDGESPSDSFEESSTQSHTSVQIESEGREIRDESSHCERFGKKLEQKGESWTLEGNQALEEALADPETLLLYPGPGAIDIESLEVAAHNKKPRTLIVVDGTWRQAGRVMREAVCVARAVEAGTVRRVQFAEAGSSGYTFRKEPHAHCLSTLESVVYALQFLERTAEQARAAEHMLGAFRLMVRLQTRHIPSNPQPLPAPAPPPFEAPGGGEWEWVEERAAARRRVYALFRTEVEHRTGEQRYVQEGAAWACTYDAAAAACKRANTARGRGQRLTVLPWPLPLDTRKLPRSAPPPSLPDAPP